MNSNNSTPEESAVIDPKLEKAIKLNEYFSSKEEFHDKKWYRARKRKNQDHHYELMKNYRLANNRALALCFKIRWFEKFGTGRKSYEETAEKWLERRNRYKEEARLKFESRYQVQFWFMSESLRSDYGTFQCDKCNRTYYHSPSNVFKGAKKIYSSCCGHCVNTILERNGQETVYH